MGRAKRIWYLSPMRAAKVQASLRIRAVSPEPPLLAHTSSESRGTFRQKTRSLAPLNGWACAVKVCHDGMLEDTNSLGGAQILMPLFCSHAYFYRVNTIKLVPASFYSGYMIPRNPGRWLLYCRNQFHFAGNILHNPRLDSHTFQNSPRQELKYYEVYKMFRPGQVKVLSVFLRQLSCF